MPISLRKGSLVVLLLSLSAFSLFSQTLYLSYDEELKDSDRIFETAEYRRGKIKDLVLLDLPFLLNTQKIEETGVPEEKKEAFFKLLQSRIDREENESEESGKRDGEPASDGKIENEDNVLLPEGDISQTEAEGPLPQESDVPETPEVSETEEERPELNAEPIDPLFSLLGIGQATADDAFVYIKMKKANIRELTDQRLFAEISFDFYLAYENRLAVYYSEIRAVGLAETEKAVLDEVVSMLHISFKSVSNTIFGKAGGPYIVNFINEKKVVIAHGRRQGAFPGSFYRIIRHKIDEKGQIGERIIGRLYVEKCEEDYSFCRILYSTERVVPGDGIQKIPGAGVHQSFGYGLLISSLAVSETQSDFYVNHLLSSRWVVNREMPIAKPAFGFEILAGSRDQIDTVGMMKSPVIGNFYVGMQVDRFFHRFSFSPFIDLGIGFTANTAENKAPLTWFTCKAGARFIWFFYEQIGIYLEGGYISWLGIPGKEAVYEDSQYIYYAPNDYTGGFGGVGFTFMY